MCKIRLPMVTDKPRAPGPDYRLAPRPEHQLSPLRLAGHDEIRPVKGTTSQEDSLDLDRELPKEIVIPAQQTSAFKT